MLRPMIPMQEIAMVLMISTTMTTTNWFSVHHVHSEHAVVGCDLHPKMACMIWSPSTLFRHRYSDLFDQMGLANTLVNWVTGRWHGCRWVLTLVDILPMILPIYPPYEIYVTLVVKHVVPSMMPFYLCLDSK